FPLTIVRGEGARLTDADGNVYVDFLGEYTAGLYGHSHPVLVQAIRDALADGMAFGAPNRYESLLAAAICERFPSVELLRFCNSGTEANLLALSLARIAPALTTFGKYLGGGFAFGAFGGRADVLSRFDPSRADALPHAGTFNNAVLTMAAGAAGLTQVYTAAEVERLNGLGDRLRDRLNEFAAHNEVLFVATGYGSMVGLHFAAGPIRRSSDLPAAPELRALLH